MGGFPAPRVMTSYPSPRSSLLLRTPLGAPKLKSVLLCYSLSYIHFNLICHYQEMR